MLRLQPALVPLERIKGTCKALVKQIEEKTFKDYQVLSFASAVAVLDVGVVSFLRLPSGDLLVERFPLITNALQGAMLVLAGDLVAQMVPKSLNGLKETKLDVLRLGKASAVGVVSVGLWPYYWYYLVDALLPAQASEDGSYPTWMLQGGLLGLKIVLDSVVHGAISIVASFALWSLLDGDSFDKGVTKIKHKFMETWVMDWKAWPAYNFLCFTIIPLRLRPLTSGFASTLWNAYISHQSQKV